MTTVPPSLTICGDGGDRLEITLMYRAHGEVADFDDGNWLEAAVKIQAGGFFGNAAVTLRAEEFRAFRNQVRELYRVLSQRGRTPVLRPPRASR